MTSLFYVKVLFFVVYYNYAYTLTCLNWTVNEPKSYIERTWKVLMSEIEVNPNISITNTKAGLEGVQLRPASPYLLVSRNCFEILIVCIKVNFYSYLYYILGQSRRLSKYFPNYKWLLPSRRVPPHVFNQLFFLTWGW